MINIRYIISILLLLLSSSCEKFLSEKPDQKLQVPATLTDLQSLLDYYNRIGTYEPSVHEVSSDDFYLEDNAWRGLTLESNRRMYLWMESNIFPKDHNDWSYCYNTIYTANTVLERIDDVETYTVQEVKEKNNIKGQALAIRGRMFMKIVFIWAPIYDANADNKFGIPLKLNTDFNHNITRASLNESYNQVEKDLLYAVKLLSDEQIHPLRTSKAGAFGLLSRFYLVKGDYEKAYLYADSCLAINSNLLDYNEVNRALTFPFPSYGKEIVLATQMLTPAMLAYTNGIINETLYAFYEPGDLRKELYFKVGTDDLPRYYGSYTGSYQLFDGIAVDEMILNRAESAIRLGKIGDGIKDLNDLLKNRWEKGKFIPVEVSDGAEALRIVLKERRKSLLMRGLRWSDIKRLNREGADIKQTREIEGEIFELLPNAAGYALPIPEQVIQISGIDQNPR